MYTHALRYFNALSNCVQDLLERALVIYYSTYQGNPGGLGGCGIGNLIGGLRLPPGFFPILPGGGNHGG